MKIPVDIYSAIEIPSEVIEKIRNILEKKYSIKILPNNIVKEDILGGLIFNIGDKQN